MAKLGSTDPELDVVVHMNAITNSNLNSPARNPLSCLFCRCPIVFHDCGNLVPSWHELFFILFRLFFWNTDSTGTSCCKQIILGFARGLVFGSDLAVDWVLSPSLQSMANVIELTVMPQNPSSSTSNSADIKAVSSEEQEPLLDIEKQEDWDSAQLKPRHTIFLSHSGAQKDFVEQLCVDLERAKQAPFFDKRPDSLPKGEEFAQLIFRAARQCQLAIVVVSEEYFSRSKWPMLELAAFTEASKRRSAQPKQAHRCTILPLFFGLSCREFGDPKRRQLWFKTWDGWAQEDPRIQVNLWKEALHELDRRNGMQFIAASGEVAYRNEVVATACSIVQKNLQVNQVFLPWMLPFLKIAFRIIFSICLFIVLVFIIYRVVVPLFFKEMKKLDVYPPPRPTCTIGENSKPSPCPDWLLDALNYTKSP